MQDKLVKKISLLLLLFLSISVISLSQKKKIIENNQSFTKVISQIEKKHNVRFSYHVEIFDTCHVSIKEFNIPLDSLLHQIKEELPVEFEKLNERFIIIKKAESPIKKDNRITIGARVIDGVTNLPLAYASVQIRNTTVGTITNESGFFDLKIEPNEHKMLLVHYLGYSPKLVTIESFIKNPELNIILYPSISQLQEAVVRQYVTKGIEINEASDEIVLSPGTMGMLPGMTENDVLHMVQLLPGVNSINESVSNLNIRGGTPDQNLVLWEGITQYSSGHFFGYFSSLNQNATKKVIVQKDHFNSEFGGRSAGVIQLTGMDEVPLQFKGGVGTHLMHSDATIQIPIGHNLAFFVSGRRSYFDLIKNRAFQKLTNRAIQDTQNNREWDEVGDDNDVVYYDISSKLLYKREKASYAISAYQMSNQVDINRVFSNENPEEEESEEDIGEMGLSMIDRVNLKNYGFSAQADLGLINEVKSCISATYTDYNSLYEGNIMAKEGDFEENENNQSINSVSDLDFQIINSLKPFKRDSLRFGYELKRLQSDYKFVYESTYEDDLFIESDELKQTYHSLFFQYKYPFGTKVNLNLGYRYTLKNEIISAFHEPRMMIGIKLSPNISYRIRAGVYRQYINQVINFNESGLAQKTWKLISKDDNNLLSSTNFSTGLLYSKDGFQVEVDAYIKRSSGVNVLSYTFSNNRNIDRDNFQEARGKTTGLDVMIKKRIHRVNLWASYTLSKNMLTLNEENEDEIFETYEVFAPQDQKHKGDISLQYKYKNFEFISSWHYRSGKPYTKALEIVQSSDNPDEPDDSYDIIYSDLNGDRLKDYHRLNLSAMYSLPLKNRMSAKFGLAITNVYNRQNALNVNYYLGFDDEEDIPIILQNNSYLLQRLINVSARLTW